MANNQYGNVNTAYEGSQQLTISYHRSRDIKQRPEDEEALIG